MLKMIVEVILIAVIQLLRYHNQTAPPTEDFDNKRIER